MDILYIKREIELSSLLGEELPSDVKEIIDYFKKLTFLYEKEEDGKESWYDENSQWTIQIIDYHSITPAPYLSSSSSNNSSSFSIVNFDNKSVSFPNFSIYVPINI